MLLKSPQHQYREKCFLLHKSEISQLSSIVKVIWHRIKSKMVPTVCNDTEIRIKRPRLEYAHTHSHCMSTNEENSLKYTCHCNCYHRPP